MAKEIKNYLKSVKEITAPLNWKSAPDSPPTQLAYVTQPEIDMLVKANIHGSMNGKPNKGPKGIISLDGGGIEEAYSEKISDKPFSSNVISSGSSGSNNPYQQAAESMLSQGITSLSGTTGGQQGSQAAQQQQDQGFQTIQQEAQEANQLDQMLQDMGLTKEEKEKQTLAEKGKDVAQGIMTKLMGGGEGGNLKLTKEEAYAKLPGGMHPLRKQYEYLKEKYGDNWANTTQAKVLEGYLSGVPVERGGGLGARSDETDAELIGPTNVDDIPMYDPVTGKYRSLEERQALAEAAQARLNALNQFAGMGSGGIGSLSAAEAGASGFDLSKLDPKQLRLGLSPDQYFRFRQQLMAADPTAENQLYKDTFPYSSGAGLSTLFEKFAPMPLKALAGMLPERDLSGYQQNIDPISVGFEPLPVPDQSNSNEPVRRPGFMPIIPLPDPSQPERPRYPLPGDPKRPPFDPPFMPDGGNFPLPVGINAFNPMFLGPSFRGSRYTNRGVSPAFYEALSRFA